MSAIMPWAGPSFDRKSAIASFASADTSRTLTMMACVSVDNLPHLLIQRVVVDELADRALALVDAGDDLARVRRDAIAVLRDGGDVRPDVLDQRVGILGGERNLLDRASRHRRAAPPLCQSRA